MSGKNQKLIQEGRLKPEILPIKSEIKSENSLMDRKEEAGVADKTTESPEDRKPDRSSTQSKGY